METIKKIAFIALLLLAAGCGGGNKSNNVGPAPMAAILTLPADNAACLTGADAGVSKSIVSFSWKSAANTDSYELVIKNLLTGESVNTSAGTNSAAVSLALNTPFSWQVVSKSNNSAATATSETRKFYNAGKGQTFYAPFPATLVSPAMGTKTDAGGGSVTLTWQGSDADNDIASYAVYFGTASSPPLLKSGVTDQSLSVTAGGALTYYWKIITTDAQGNTSDSGVSAFNTN